jgi:hypothetical protein
MEGEGMEGEGEEGKRLNLTVNFFGIYIMCM